jgi:hypothetical protein
MLSAMAADEPPQLVASVGPLDAVVALLHGYLHRSGALRVMAVVEGDPGAAPAVVDCGRLRPTEVEAGGRTVLVPHGAAVQAEEPALPDVRRFAPFAVDPESAEVIAPPGAVAHLADSVRDLADRLGGRNVAMGQFETDHAEAPLSITARAGGEDPIVLAIGEEEFEMDPGWPERPGRGDVP